MEIAFKNTVIAKEYGLTLKSFFKDIFKYWDDSYLIPFIDIRFFKKQCYDFIISCCNNKCYCSKKQSCYGHQFLQFVETIIQFQRYFVLKKKVYFQYFFFTDFKLTSDTLKIKSWRIFGVSIKLIDHLTYSERLSFLADKKNENKHDLFKKRKSLF